MGKRPFSKQPFTDYNGQYEWAKNKISKAIENNENIVLFGEGRNGKTYITNEFSQVFRDRKYGEILYSGVEPRLLNNWCVDLKKKGMNFMCHINNLSELDGGLKFQDYVFINMNNYTYEEN